MCLLYNWRNKKERQKTIPFGLFFLVAVHAVSLHRSVVSTGGQTGTAAPVPSQRCTESRPDTDDLPGLDIIIRHVTITASVGPETTVVSDVIDNFRLFNATDIMMTGK